MEIQYASRPREVPGSVSKRAYELSADHRKAHAKRYTRHEVPAPRAVGTSGRTVSYGAEITPQAIRFPAAPVGSVFWSSGFSCTMIEVPKTEFGAPGVIDR
jgi:hypothetical protein